MPDDTTPQDPAEIILRFVLPTWLDAAGLHVEAETLRQVRKGLALSAMEGATAAVERVSRVPHGQVMDAAWVARRRAHMDAASAALVATYPKQERGLWAIGARRLARVCAVRAAHLGSLAQAVAKLSGAEQEAA